MWAPKCAANFILVSASCRAMGHVMCCAGHMTCVRSSYPDSTLFPSPHAYLRSRVGSGHETTALPQCTLCMRASSISAINLRNVHFRNGEIGNINFGNSEIRNVNFGNKQTGGFGMALLGHRRFQPQPRPQSLELDCDWIQGRRKQTQLLVRPSVSLVPRPFKGPGDEASHQYDQECIIEERGRESYSVYSCANALQII